MKVVPGNLAAAYTSDLYLAIPGMSAINFGTNWDLGRVTQLGKIEVEKELVFKIAVRNTGDVFYSGVAARNSQTGSPGSASKICGMAAIGATTTFASR